MKKIVIILFVILILFPGINLFAYPFNGEIKNLLESLDSLIELKEVFKDNKEEKINGITKLRAEATSEEEIFLFNSKLYDEYFVYNADSAMRYTEENIEIATARKDWNTVKEWKIKKSFLLAATGLLKEAQDELRGMNGKSLPRELAVSYYGQLVYLFSHFHQYTGEEEGKLHTYYSYMEDLYLDSLRHILVETDPDYLWYKGQAMQFTDSMLYYRNLLQQILQDSPLDTRKDAMIAYLLACYYRESGEQTNYIKYLIYSAMADVRTSNKDIASLEELAGVLFDLGDIDHAYSYMNYCLNNALSYRSRVRVVGISSVQENIHKKNMERNQEQEAKLRFYLILVSILSVFAVGAVILIYTQMKKLKNSRKQLNDANMRLNKHIDELSEMQKQMAKANEQLKSLNEKLKDTNTELSEANHVKEEYIGYVFSMCSNYIGKIEEFRKAVKQKLIANRLTDLKEMVDSSTLLQDEMKEFYQNFDTIFLNIYPDFVNDFNELLQPEARIVLKEGELLNTELRIYALVRLGITDSVKIAEILHYSPQTVYNNRLKTRNKAIVPKKEFANIVRTLGMASKQI